VLLTITVGDRFTDRTDSRRQLYLRIPDRVIGDHA